MPFGYCYPLWGVFTTPSVYPANKDNGNKNCGKKHGNFYVHRIIFLVVLMMIRHEYRSLLSFRWRRKKSGSYEFIILISVIISIHSTKHNIDQLLEMGNTY